LGALTAQLLHACSDHRKIVSGAGSSALVAQLLHACSDYREIGGGAGVGSPFLPLLVDADVIIREVDQARVIA